MHQQIACHWCTMIRLFFNPVETSCWIAIQRVDPFFVEVPRISSPSARSRGSSEDERVKLGLVRYIYKRVGWRRPKVHFVFGMRMCQLSPLTHRTSIRFCTQSCRRIKRRGCRGDTLGTSQSALPIDRRTFSSTYCLPDLRGRGCVLKGLFDGIHLFARLRKPFVIAYICCLFSNNPCVRS